MEADIVQYIQQCLAVGILMFILYIYHRITLNIEYETGLIFDIRISNIKLTSRCPLVLVNL